MNQNSDTQPRAVDIRFPEVRLVEASAGAGKTYALARRYLQLLFHVCRGGPEHCRSILAITFTNKASREMKERILEFLKRLVLGAFRSEEEKKQLLAFLGLDEEQARAAASRVLGYLIRNYNFFQVKTIDSFINALLVGCAFKLDLSAGFRILHGYDEHLGYSLDTLIERAEHEPALRELFAGFLRQFLFVEDKRSWLPQQDIKAIMGAMFFHQNVFGRAFREYDTQGDDMFMRQRSILKLLNEVARRLPEGTTRTFADMLRAYLEEYTTGFSVRAFSEKKSLRSDQIPVRKGTPAVDPAVNGLWQKAQREIAALARLEAYALFNCYIKLFDKARDEFLRRARQDDVVFVSELNRYAHDLLGQEAVSVPELYYRLAARFRHYLIDEFQDTSGLQWRNVFGLVEEALSTGGTLFCVGDRKQSIYRFRGGDPALFHRVARQLTHFNVTTERLQDNYRSRENVVAFNNEVFSGENLRRLLAHMQEHIRRKDPESPKLLSLRQLDEVAETFSDSRQASRPDKPGGMVRVEMTGGRGEEGAEEVLTGRLFSLLDELAGRWAWHDIAILCRANDEVERVSEWLISRDIPVESEKTLNLTEHPCIKELVSLLMFLDSPIDDLAFASFITGDIFCQGTGADAAAMRGFVFRAYQARKAGEKTGALYRRFQQELPQVWEEYVQEFFKTANLAPLYELVSSVYRRFDVLGRFPAHQGFCMRFLEIIKLQEEERPTINEFLRYVREAPAQELYVQTLETDAVKVMTVHKAKGLEFRVVIAPFLRLDPKPVMRSDRQSVAYLVTQADQDEELSLVRLHTAYTRYVPQIKQVYGQAYQQALCDELNMLYVACTRASDELYVFIPEKSGSAANPLVDLVPESWRRVGTPQKAPAKQKPVRPAVTLGPGTRRDWLGFLIREFESLTPLRQRQAAQRGELLHAVLARIKPLACKSEIGPAVDQAVRFLTPRVHDAAEIADCMALIERLLAQDEVFSLFQTGPWQALREQEVVTADGRTLRIDRLLLGEQDARVVDFKSAAAAAPEHLAQVREYCRVVKELFPEKNVRGYLLMMDSGRMVTVKGYDA